jgi:hypothetical protein
MSKENKFTKPAAGMKPYQLAPKALIDNAGESLTLKSSVPGFLFSFQIIGLAFDQHLV